jgi:hypothetical protein
MAPYANELKGSVAQAVGPNLCEGASDLLEQGGRPHEVDDIEVEQFLLEVLPVRAGLDGRLAQGQQGLAPGDVAVGDDLQVGW